LSALPDDPIDSAQADGRPAKPRSPRWRRIVLWTLAVLLGIAAVAIVGVSVLLRSQRFHNYVLTEVQKSASQALGVPVELQNYTVHFSGINPTADLYGLVVHGAAPFSNIPLLQVEHARIGVRVVSLLRQKWYLSEVVIDRPVVQLRVDSSGNNNLPQSQNKAPSNGVQPLFDLAIRHALLDGGQVYYNDRQIALDADLHDLALNAAYDAAHNVYAGQLSYSDAHLRSGAYEPIPHALSAQFEMTPSHLDIRKAELRSGNSAVAFTASLDDFNNPRVATVYHISADAAELRRILRTPQIPLGVLQLDGHANYAHASYAAQPNQPALSALTLEGTLRSGQLDFALPNGAQTLRTQARAIRATLIRATSIRATYTLSGGDAELRSFSASLFSGSVEASAAVRNLTGEQSGSAHFKLNGISLAAFKQLAAQLGTPANNLVLGGAVEASGEASWKGSVRNLLATADATIRGSAGSAAQAQNATPRSIPVSIPGVIPITGELHASYRNSDQQLTLRQSSLRTPQTTLAFDGTTGQRSQMNLLLNAADLHEIESIAGFFSHPAQPLALYGSATFSGAISGPVAAPRLTGQFHAANLRLHGSAWKQLQAHLDASQSAVDIQHGELQPVSTKSAPQGNITFSGHAQLKHWSFAPESQFQLALNGQRLDAAQLAQLAGSTTAVGGTLNVDVQAQGTALNPIGQGRVELLRASVAGEPIQSVVADFSGDGNTAHANLRLVMPAGAATGTLTYQPSKRSYQAQLAAHGFKLDQLQTIKARNLSIAGPLNLDASGQGTLDDPQLTATIAIPQLHAQGQTIDSVSLQANVAQHAATVEVSLRALNAQLNGHATVQLTGDYEAAATLDTQPIQLQPVLAAYAPNQASSVTGQTELHATLRGPLRHRDRIEAHMVVPEFSLHYQKSIDLALTGPIHADYVNGVLSVQHSGLKGTGTDLQFQGSLPVLDRTKPVELLLLGSVDLQLAQLLDPDVTSSGQLRFNINSYGALANPNVKGQVEIVNANFATADAPLGLSNGNGTLALTSDRLNITNFSGTMGGGNVTASGGVVYRPALQFDVVLAARGVRMLYPEGVRQGLSADLTLTGTPERAVLRGQVNVDQLSFAPDFDVSNLAALGGGVEEPPSRGFASNLQLNVALRSSQSVNVVSRTMSASGTANLRATGTASDPVILGRINLTSGDLIFQGNRYVLQSAEVDFVNPSRTEPTINASVTTTIQQYNVGIRVEGQLDHLRTSYSSDPALPPADIISLIAFGKTQEASNAPGNTQTGQQTAEQSIASAVSGQVTNRLQKIAGISYISVDPTLGIGQQNADATITVQQRVTSKIFVTFSTDITGTEQQVIQVQYQATPAVSLSGTRDQNGGFGFDTRITREW
jgi:translocation and assembly module TamB